MPAEVSDLRIVYQKIESNIEEVERGLRKTPKNANILFGMRLVLDMLRKEIEYMETVNPVIELLESAGTEEDIAAFFHKIEKF